MGNVETFITIHDQNILLNCEEQGQFSSLSSYKYLFVGPRPVDNLSEKLLKKTIVCRDYTPNYEHIPHLYDFTGWYVLAKHDLMDKEYAICLQYDHFISTPVLEQLCINKFQEGLGMISFVRAMHYHYVLQVAGFDPAIRKALATVGLTVENLPISNWPSTQGTAWRSDSLKDFLLWVEPVFDVIKNEKYAGHIAERMVVAYSSLTHPAMYLEGYVGHMSADCHGTGAAMAGREDIFFQKSITFGQ